MKNQSLTVKKINFILLGSFIILLFLVGCKKDLNDSSITTSSQAKDDLPYPLAWESSSFLPSSPANVVYYPWYGSGGAINANIASDYKSSDGWVMIYNTFSPTTSPYYLTAPAGGLYFALYNIYRGLLRFYLYLPPGIVQSTTNISSGLSLNTTGLTSSMLNFENVDIVDANSNTQSVSKFNNQQVASLGNWIVTQYEIAYDPNISTTSYPNFGLTWSSKPVNVSVLKMDGTQIGTITGEINNPGGYDWGGVLTNLAVAGLEVYGVSDLNGLTALGGKVGAQASAMQSAIGSALGNTISGLFSAITGGNSSNSQEVYLTMNTQIALQGTLTSSSLLTNPNFVISGQQNASTAYGPNPNYNSPLGVFNLKTRPIVYAHSVGSSSILQPGLMISGDKTTFSFDKTLSNNLIINPAVSAVANVNVISAQLYITYNTTSAPNRANPISDGILQTIGSYTGYLNPTYYTYIWEAPQTAPLTNISNAYIVLTMTVTPTDPNFKGTPPTITKTFLADIVNN